MYVSSADEQKEFFYSVERGWYELHSGIGTVVAEDDTFFDSIREKSCGMLKRPLKPSEDQACKENM